MKKINLSKNLNNPPHCGRRRLKALITKEFFQIIRDPSSLLISLALPLLLLFLYGFGMSLDLDHLNIGLALEDSSPEARSFAQSMVDSPYFNVTVKRDRREFLNDINSGYIRGFVVIPSYFSAFKARNTSIAPIQVIADGSEPNTAAFVQNYVQGAYQIWLKQEIIESGLPTPPSINVQSRFWYNEELESRFFLLPGSLAIIMTLIGTLLTALVVSREWERGTMEAVMSTPVTISELVMSKLIPYFILGMTSLIICVALSIVIFDLPLRGSWFLLGLVSALFLFAALGSGLLISTISKNQVVASQISMVTGFLPAYMLSGFIFEIPSMPQWLQFLTYIIPARYYVQTLQTLFLVGNVWHLILVNMIPIVLIGTLIYLIVRKKTVKRLD